MLIAVIDIGSNTFKLLLAEADGSNLKILRTEKRGLKLGAGSYSSKSVSDEDISKAISTLKEFQTIAEEAGADIAGAFATAAIRDAENNSDFIRRVKEETGIEISLISGDREAELIAKGVESSMTRQPEEFLIMDIGGGSTEFIKISNNRMVWRKSFPLGAYRLIRELKPADPVSYENIAEFNDLAEKKLAELKELSLQTLPLVGCSGSFETFSDMISMEIQASAEPPQRAIVENNKKDLDLLFDLLLKSSRSEREKMKGLPDYRLHTIVPGTLLVNWYRNTFRPEKVFTSYRSMKEGAIIEIMNKRYNNGQEKNTRN